MFAASFKGKSVFNAAGGPGKVHVEDLATVKLNLALLKEYAFCLNLIVLIVPQFKYLVLFEYSIQLPQPNKPTQTT